MSDSEIVFQEDLDEPQIHVAEDGFSRVYRLGVTKGLLNKKLTQEILEYKDRFNIPGFRKGKAPLSVILNRVPEKEKEEFLQRYVREQIQEHLHDSDKIVIGTPEIDTDYANETDMVAKISISYEVSPEVQDLDYDKYSILKFVPEDREKLLEKIRQDFLAANPEKVPQDKDYKSKIGDYLMVDMTIEAPGTSADGYIEKAREVLVEENSSIYDVKFNSIGLVMNEELTIESELPSFYDGFEEAGKPCKFHFKIAEVLKSNIIDEPTLEMAKKFGFQSVEELDVELLNRKLQQFESISAHLMTDQFVLKMEMELDFDVPKKVLNSTMENIWFEENKDDSKSETANPEKDNEKNAKDVDDIENVETEEVLSEQNDEVSSNNGTSEDPKRVDWDTIDAKKVTEIRNIALNQVRYMILLKNIAKKEDIKATREEIVDEWAVLLARYNQSPHMNMEELRSRIKYEDIPDYFALSSQNKIVSYKVEQFIMGKVGTTEMKVSFEKLMEIRQMERDKLIALMESDLTDQESEPEKD
ncbi:MAG: hypothetical protein F4203_08295 [Rhodobacteraceae bacterium]|nr:hypothetical protein [Paracoccaceae bacterium]